MAPDTLAAQLTALAVAVAAAATLALTWDRTTGWRRAPLRAATITLTVAAALATAAITVNRQAETYPTWSDLLGGPGTGPPAAEAAPAAPGGGRLISFTVTGAASGLTLPVYAYLPAAYDHQPARRFPVIEALHGYPGGPMGWLRMLAAPRHLDAEITAGRMAPTVVLFPYQTPDPALDTECLDLTHGPHADTFLTVDVPTAARAHLRIRDDRAGWALIGYSAGGYCATNLALHHPDRYAAAASLSGYADPGISVGDGSEHTGNDDAWRLRHLPPPPIALYLGSGGADQHALRDTRTLTRLAHAPTTVTTTVVPGGGHGSAVWQAMEGPAFDWLSGWLARPTP